MFRFTAGAVACALFLSGSAAFAAAESSASISGLTFTLVDLDIDDGIAAGFSFDAFSSNTSLSFSVNDGLGGSENYSKNRAGFLSFTRSTGSVAGEPVAYEVSISGDALSAYGAAAGANTSYSVSATSGSSYNYYGYNNLSLTANTVLIIKAQADVFASATNPSSCGGCSSEYATANATMNLSYSYTDGGSSVSGSSSNVLSTSAVASGAYTYSSYSYDFNQWDYWNYPIYQDVTVPGVEQTLSDAKKFKSVFTNSSDSTQTAMFYMSTSVSGNASNPFAGAIPGGDVPVTAVPEPESYAMVLAGLMVVGAMAYRRRAA